jgi:hypothetical protein
MNKAYIYRSELQCFIRAPHDLWPRGGLFRRCPEYTIAPIGMVAPSLRGKLGLVENSALEIAPN